MPSEFEVLVTARFWLTAADHQDALNIARGLISGLGRWPQIREVSIREGKFTQESLRAEVQP